MLGILSVAMDAKEASCHSSGVLRLGLPLACLPGETCTAAEGGRFRAWTKWLPELQPDSDDVIID